MPTKVLVFESDPAFAGELKIELGRVGLVAQVVDDGTAGLMAAASEKPDLILLSIELPRMNGFSVCNKLKRDPALKDVPLIIMSSDSTDETFDQHRKLRTRAEDYVHKPIAIGELLEHLGRYVKIENGVPPSSVTDDIIIDDVEIADANGASEAPPPASGRVDAEVEAFADTAFDRLLESEAPAARVSAAPPVIEAPPPPAPVAPVLLEPPPPSLIVEAPAPLAPPPLPTPPSPPPPIVEEKRSSVPSPASILPRVSSVPPRPTVDAEVERLRGDLERQKTELARVERELNNARAEIQRLELAASQETASNETVVKLQRELDEVRLKATSGGKVAGVSSREFLDLREALNKKDKEILSLRDQVTRKEKELLDASDSALALERDKADLEDRIAALDKDAQVARALADTAKADKEQAAKRAEDFKARSEKLKTELEAKTAELTGIQKKHEDEAGAALAEARAAEAKAHEEALAKLREEALADKNGAVAAREAELQKEHESRLAALETSHVEELKALREELSKTTESAAVERSRGAERSRELEDLREGLLKAQKSELETRHVEVLRAAETRATDLATDLSSRTEEREILARDLAKVKEKLQRAEGVVAETKAELASTKEKLAAQNQKVDGVNAKWEQNKAAFELAKDALAAAVAQIEEAEARGV